jgi:hypothetical protein
MEHRRGLPWDDLEGCFVLHLYSIKKYAEFEGRKLSNLQTLENDAKDAKFSIYNT